MCIGWRKNVKHVWLYPYISPEPYIQTSPNCLCMLSITVVWSSSGDVAIRYVLPVYSFSHIRPCGACEGSAQNDLAKEARILHCSVYSNWLITRGSTSLISMTASFYRTASFVNAQCKIQTSDVNMSWLESLRKYSKVAKLQNCNEYRYILTRTDKNHKWANYWRKVYALYMYHVS